MVQLAGHQPTASGKKPHSRVICHRRVVGGQAGPRGQPDEQRGRIVGGKVSRLIAVASSSAVRCRRLVTTHQAPRRARQQRPDLLAADRVVEQQQNRRPATLVAPQPIRASSPGGIC